MLILNLTVDGTTLVAKTIGQITTGGKDQFEATLTVSEEWEGMVLTVFFNGYPSPVFNETVKIPNSSLLSNKLYVCVIGTKKGVSYSSTVSEIVTKDGCAFFDIIEDEETGHQWEEYVLLIDQKIEELSEQVNGSKDEILKSILGENVDERFDTLKEISDWILGSDDTESSDGTLVARILKLETSAHAHNNGTVLDKITQESLDKWDQGGGAIDSILVGGEKLPIKDKIVQLPTATAQTMGLVSVDNESIEVINGVIGIKAVEITSVFVDANTEFILNCNSKK